MVSKVVDLPLVSVVADRIRRFIVVEDEEPVDARFLKEILGNKYWVYCNQL